MNNIINFSNLGRKEIRRIIGEGENQIIIYNPNTEQRAKIIDTMFENVSEDSKEINITGYDVLLKLIPVITNVNFDLDIEKDKEIIEQIINDPSDELKETVKEIRKISEKILKDIKENMDDLNNLPKENVVKIMKDFQTKEELKVQKTNKEKEEELLKELQNNISDKEKRDKILDELNKLRKETQNE